MIRIDSTYSNYFDNTDPGYPAGKAIDASTDEGIDGTPYCEKWMNDIIGARQALWVAAFGDITGISGNPDKVGDSDVLKAILQLIEKKLLGCFLQIETDEAEPLIPWGSLNRTYNSNITYLVYAVMTDDTGDVLPIRTRVDSSGLHLVIREIKDGKVQNIVRQPKWGSFKFGEKKWGEAVPFKINIIIKEA